MRILRMIKRLFDNIELEQSKLDNNSLDVVINGTYRYFGNFNSCTKYISMYTKGIKLVRK